MLIRLHAIAGGVALVLILEFWLATAIAEAFLGPEQIFLVKTAILWAMAVLIPALIVTGVTGFRLAGRAQPPSPEVRAKKRRQILIMLNGVFVLLPSASYLAQKATTATFDGGFIAVQILELVAGAVNIYLMVKNMRAGLRLTGRMISRRPTVA